MDANTLLAPSGKQFHEIAAAKIVAHDEVGLQDDALIRQRSSTTGVAIVGVYACMNADV